MIKISRNICLIKYRNFPLRDFENGNEIHFHPKINSVYWLKLKNASNLSNELEKLCGKLNIEALIFLGDYKRSWISKFTKKRNDNPDLANAVNYFDKISNGFNGAIKVNITELSEFLEHFITLTKCDGDFVYYNFLDENQTLLGFIHYSGEVRFDTINKKSNELFLEKIIETKFLDTFREDSCRI